ncbi:hypothetical protein QJS04_geneDACA018840 [Acorus gramineus]|uniref:Uncharacterized protein n=1 Tax=Acorus gramineus TaxID=55184 RepID=A0AAV9BNI7_ACOGR|nr:hypothetical protein QJS04_geneDACA018840 [Acorus gramineus]
MTKFYCFSMFVGRKKKSKVSSHSGGDSDKGVTTIQVKNSNSTSYSSTRVVEREDPIKVAEEAVETAAYEGEDEHDDLSVMKSRDFSEEEEEEEEECIKKCGSEGSIDNDRRLYGEEEGTPIQSGHVSDPGTRRPTFCASPKLKRSCSNLETRDLVRRIANPLSLSPSKSYSFDGRGGGEALQGSPHSADRVMLKKRSSSQVLPSRSRRLWWKLFLWSHRNLHVQKIKKPSDNEKGGYSSDTLPNPCQDDKNKEQSGLGLGDQMKHQWVAFSMESSPLGRVDAWVNSLDVESVLPVDDDVDDDDVARMNSFFEVGESSGKNNTQKGRRGGLAEEVLQANNIIQSLNSFSSVAHISGIGLKAIPIISAFASLRSVNLSGNFIAQITPGALPKSLHSLDLSRNKITAIEGLRELTRLRVLNLSYNRISRIGHGLSNCMLIKELYLAGNKISEVEGLHRLLKLAVLDLSFNKITTAKALGQLVANYSSLMALNLLGNPVQSNIGDDQLRKTMSGLLPQLAYLNKQSIKPRRAREVAGDSVARAALGNNGFGGRRKPMRRVSHVSSSSSSFRGRIIEVDGHRSYNNGHGQRSRHRSRSNQQHSPSTRK